MRVGEVFINGGRTGSDMDAVTRDAAVLLSIALQYGVPVETIAHAITRESNGSASSIIGAVVDRLPILELPI
jgi:ribonucleoside-diphosphate reductase alpha chain